MTVRHIFEISEDDHPPNTPTPLVTDARGHWWTLDFANAFVSPGVNSRGELVPSHGALRRRLGDYLEHFYVNCSKPTARRSGRKPARNKSGRKPASLSYVPYN
jgi:hypothetical protein